MSLSERPPLCLLGSAENFAAYRAEFDNLYRAVEFRDVLGRLVVFAEDRAEHICYVEEREDRYKQGPRKVWNQVRAERIRWIELALKYPDEIRPDHIHPRHQAYLLTIPSNPAHKALQERYVVYVEPLSATEVRFATGYPIRENNWIEAVRKGPRIYPPPKLKTSRGKKR